MANKICHSLICGTLKEVNNFPTSPSIYPLSHLWKEGYIKWTNICMALVPPKRSYESFRPLRVQIEWYCIHFVYVIYFYWTHGDAEVSWVTASELGTLCAWGMSPLEAALMHGIHPDEKHPSWGCSSQSITLQFTPTCLLKWLTVENHSSNLMLFFMFLIHRGRIIFLKSHKCSNFPQCSFGAQTKRHELLSGWPAERITSKWKIC